MKYEYKKYNAFNDYSGEDLVWENYKKYYDYLYYDDKITEKKLNKQLEELMKEKEKLSNKEKELEERHKELEKRHKELEEKEKEFDEIQRNFYTEEVIKELEICEELL
jgi:predicted  nucleic acid-binding Zn-ribbon protein